MSDHTPPPDRIREAVDLLRMIPEPQDAFDSGFADLKRTIAAEAVGHVLRRVANVIERSNEMLPGMTVADAVRAIRREADLIEQGS